MEILLGFGQITYYVVFVVAVLLVSIGSDYNVYLAGQVWHEGRRRSLRKAVELGATRAARPIRTA
jgi:RND superfamily putative drug exporter